MATASDQTDIHASTNGPTKAESISEKYFRHASDLERGQSPATQDNHEDLGLPIARRIEGYPEFAQWMGGCNDFFLLRKFSSLMARTCLKLQDDLMMLEGEIRLHDTRQLGSNDGDNGRFRGDRTGRNEILMEKVVPRLKQYYDLINAYNALKTRGTASRLQIQNVRNWLHNHPDALSPAETAFADEDHTVDLFPVYQRQRSPIWLLFERYADWAHCLNPSYFRKRDTTRRHHSKRVDRWVAFFIVGVGYVLLFVPIWLEEMVTGSKARLGIVMGAVLFFAAFSVNATTSPTRGLEVLGATAAYTAVLMVYLQNGS